MLEINPKSWFSWNFRIMEGADRVADVDVSRWREKGQLQVDGNSFEVYREGLMSGRFLLESAGSIVASAEKPSAMRRMFTIQFEGKEYTLKSASVFGRKMAFLEGSLEIGTLSPTSIFSRRAKADLPEILPLPVRVFVIWLAVILWKRDSDAGAAQGS